MLPRFHSPRISSPPSLARFPRSSLTSSSAWSSSMSKMTATKKTMAMRVLLLLLPLLSNHGLSAASLASGDKKVDADAAFALDATNFNSTLLATTSPFAIVEFYAHWCPACRNYKPQYEQVARLFNGPDAVHPGILFMANVDCASKINNMLCDQFKVSHYPTLLWAPPLKSAWVPGARAEWEMIQNAYSAELLLQAINKKIGKSYKLSDVRYFKEPSLIQGGELNFQKVAVSIHDIEEATAKSMDIIVADKLLSRKTRPAFIQLLQLLVVHHPSRTCKRGAADLLTNLEDYWPSFTGQPRSEKGLADGSVVSIGDPDFKSLEAFHICGDHMPQDKWIFCRGSRKDTRGYSCGLWLLFHALSVRVEDKLAPIAFRTICGFVGNFFNCKECSEHFLKFCSSANGKVSSRRELVLWLWDVHNKVNERLGKEEASLGTADPEFLKQYWPSEALCKPCWKAQAIKQPTENRTEEKSFQLPEVYNFLIKFYGQALLDPNVTVSSSTMKEGTLLTESEAVTENSITVTLGAALAVAFACCGFAAIACFWQNQQKKRKQVRRHA